MFFNEKSVVGYRLDRLLKPVVQQGRSEQSPEAYKSRTPQGSCDVRTPLEAGFSNRLDEGWERRIDDRMTDQPCQPCRHQLLC